MYPVLPEETQAWLWQEAETQAPNEAVGLLAGAFRGPQRQAITFGYYCRLKNVANEAHVAFELEQAGILTLAKMLNQKQDIPAIWHSHVQASPAPSPQDVDMLERIQIPMLIVSLTFKKMVLYSVGSTGKVMPWGAWGK